MKADIEKLKNLILGYQYSQIIFVSVKLNIIDLILHGNNSDKLLSKQLNIKEENCKRLLRALIILGLVIRKSSNIYSITKLGMLLSDSARNSLKLMAQFWGTEWQWKPWGELLYSIKTNKQSFKKIFNKNFFDYINSNSEANFLFTKFTENSPTNRHKILAESFDFSQFSSLLDIGGSTGVSLVEIKKKYPELRVGLLEKPYAIERAKKYLHDNGFTNQVELINEDFFKNIPVNYDAYLLFQVIHDWEDKKSIKILKNIKKYANKNAKVLVVEQLISSNTIMGACMDLCMLTHVGGKERDLDEFKLIFEQAGLKFLSLHNTNSPYYIIEGEV